MMKPPVKIEWREELHEVFHGILGGHPEEIITEIETETAELWEHETGYVITRLERDIYTGEYELVIVAGAGSDLKGVVTWWCDFADENNLNLRIHSEKPGFLRMLKPLGFHAAETIYKRGHNGREK
jgi:hypothetical protein